MAIKESKGNVYYPITHKWNPVRGECPYKCSYCYVRRWGRAQKPLHIDRKDLKSPLGAGRFIFICSGCDLFHPDVPEDWIADVRNQTLQYPDNRYLWHTKNPQRLVELIDPGPSDVACVTIETTNEFYLNKFSKAPQAIERLVFLKKWKGRKMIAIEPIMSFFPSMADMIISCRPDQVNIGADSGRNRLPEPTLCEIEQLVYSLEKNGITVRQKKNLNRLPLM
jgi:DNA repair photolyase